MARRVTMRFRPEDLKDDPRLLAFVRDRLNVKLPDGDEEEITIDRDEPAPPPEPDLATEKVVRDAATKVLAESRQQASARAEAAAAGQAKERVTGEDIVEEVERETHNAIGRLALRGVGIAARIVEFAITVSGAIG